MLLNAAKGGRTEEVIALLDAGANIDATDKVRLLHMYMYLLVTCRNMLPDQFSIVRLITILHLCTMVLCTMVLCTMVHCTMYM